MTVVTTIHEAREQRAKLGKLALVPTMGALHRGHLSLIEYARQSAPFTAVSIFVNPTQFGPSEDFKKYPRTLDADLELMASLRVDLVLAPPAEEIYAPNFDAYVVPGKVAEPLEGAFRPTHFRGVATIV